MIALAGNTGLRWVGRRRKLGGGIVPPITPIIFGPLPAIQPLIAGESLGEAVTWPTLTTNVGSLNSPVRSMRISGGELVPYDAAFVPDAGATIEIQQVTTSTAGATRTDTAGPVDVIAPQGWVLSYGDGQITIIQMPPVPTPVIFAGDGQIIIQEYT